MPHFALTGLAAVCASAGLCTALAQAPTGGVTAVRTPDPLDARAPVARLVHRSVLADYRAAAEPAMTPWPKANETVNRIGGWRSYLRESQPAPAADAPHRHR